MLALAKSIGGISAMAERLGKSQSQISQLIGSAPVKDIGHKIAAEAEKAFNKPEGWLDHLHDDEIAPCYHIISLLEWNQVSKWEQHPKLEPIEDIKVLLPLGAQIGARAYALKIQDDTMEAPRGISFPKGSVIIVDPDLTAKPGSFVVAYAQDNRLPTFKRLVIDGQRYYLNPLNTRYPILEVSKPISICGVVKQMLMYID